MHFKVSDLGDEQFAWTGCNVDVAMHHATINAGLVDCERCKFSVKYKIAAGIPTAIGKLLSIRDLIKEVGEDFQKATEGGHLKCCCPGEPDPPYAHDHTACSWCFMDHLLLDLDRIIQED